MPCFSNSATVLSSAAARSGRGICFTSSSRGIPSSGVAVIGIIHRRLVTDNVIIGYKKFFDKGFEKEVGGVLCGANVKVGPYLSVLVLYRIARSPT